MKKSLKDQVVELFSYGDAYTAKRQYIVALKAAQCNSSFNYRKHFPCYRCLGEGFREVACSYYEYSNKQCERCDGNGFLTKEEYQKIFDDKAAKEKQQRTAEKKIKTELARIKKKLTRAELEFLKKHV